MLRRTLSRMSIEELLAEQEAIGRAFDSAVERGSSIEVLDVLMRQMRELSRLIAEEVA